MPLDTREVALVKGMLLRGDRQHDIAAYFGVNGGRIGEISTRLKGDGVSAALPDELPPKGPYMAGRSSLRARDTLLALRDLIDGAIQDIEQYESVAEPPSDSK
jgi:hypothetical protein